MTAKTRFTFMVYGAGGYDRKKYVEDIYKGVKADMLAIFDIDEMLTSSLVPKNFVKILLWGIPTTYRTV